jgi:hypothetical protein
VALEEVKSFTTGGTEYTGFGSGKPAGVPGTAVMACRGQDSGLNPSGQRSAGLAGTGSVVGIQIEVGNMYTGTLINDLMATVEQVRETVQQRQAEEQYELHAIFAMQIPMAESDQLFMGAA